MQVSMPFLIGTLLLIPSAWVVNAGASAAASSHKPIANGWVQAAGEVRIYKKREDLGRLYDGSCISGVMANHKLLPKYFSNRHVIAYGTILDKSEIDEMTKRGITIGLENYCAGDNVAIITKVVLVDAHR